MTTAIDSTLRVNLMIIVSRPCKKMSFKKLSDRMKWM